MADETRDTTQEPPEEPTGESAEEPLEAASAEEQPEKAPVYLQAALPQQAVPVEERPPVETQATSSSQASPSAQAPSQAPPPPVQPRAANPPLHSERGITRIEEPVVSKIAGLAAQEVDGVRMGSGASRALGSIVDTVSRGGSERRGVNVEVGKVEAAVDLTLAIQYGRNIPQVAANVRDNVIRRIENLVGLRVTEVNIVVDDIYFEGEQPRVEGEAQETAGARVR